MSGEEVQVTEELFATRRCVALVDVDQSLSSCRVGGGVVDQCRLLQALQHVVLTALLNTLAPGDV